MTDDKSPSESKGWSVLWWFLGVLYGLVALGELGTGRLPRFVICTLACVVLVPPLSRKAGRVLGITFTKKLKFIAIALAIVMMAATDPGERDNGGTPSTAVAPKPVRSEAKPRSASKPAQEAPKSPEVAITAGIDDFKAIPILQQRPMETKEREDRIDYIWSKVSLRGKPNMVAIYDDAKDGTIDSLMVSLVFSQDEADVLESLALGYKMLAMATRRQEEGDLPDRFSKWLTANLKQAAEKEVTTTFDGLPVSFNAIPANGGAVAILVMGDQSKHHSK